MSWAPRRGLGSDWSLGVDLLLSAYHSSECDCAIDTRPTLRANDTSQVIRGFNAIKSARMFDALCTPCGVLFLLGHPLCLVACLGARL